MMWLKSKLIIVNSVTIWNNRYKTRVFAITLEGKRKTNLLIG